MDKEFEYTDEIETEVTEKDGMGNGILEDEEKNNETDSETVEVSDSDIINASNEDINYIVDEDSSNNVVSGIYLCEKNNDVSNTNSDVQLEAELRTLRSDLQFNTSEYGDWRMAKAMESLLIGINNCDKDDVVNFVKGWAKNTYDRIGEEITTRIQKRKRINEIQEELEKVSVIDVTNNTNDSSELIEDNK